LDDELAVSMSRQTTVVVVVRLSVRLRHVVVITI
jgi:hypothetical protein